MGNETIHLSVSEEEKRRIRAEAGKRDLSMSEFGRDVLVDWLDENASPQAAES